MAKITDSVYAVLSSPATNDVLPIVDVSDTTMSPAGTTKQTTVADILAAGAAGAEALVPTGVKTGAYNAVAGDFVSVNTTSAAVTITLPNAPAAGTIIGVKLAILGSGHAVTVARNGSGTDVFNVAGGSTSLSLTRLFQTVVVLYASGVWYVTSTDPAIALDATSTDIVALGAQAAGATGKAADAGHVHPTTGVLLSGATASGDLSGTYPGPVVAKINGTAFTLPVSVANGGTNTGSTSQSFAFIGPVSGSGAPLFRAIGAGDLPTGAASLLGLFGNGSDGSLNFDGTTTVLGLAPSTGTYTLNRDIQATSIQVGGGGTATTIKTGNFRIFCQGTVTIAANGTVSNAGNAASGSVAGGKTNSGSLTLVAGNIGGTGGTGVSGAGLAGGTAQWGAAGGAGGAGTSGAAGAGGTVTPATLTTTVATNNVWITPGPALTVVTAWNGSTVQMGGAAGGGGGGSDASSFAGGGGGGGGGMVIIFAWAIANAGSITAAGGAGAAGAAGNAGGGGGGSGGFILAYTLSAWTGSGTTTVTGGTGGAHGGTGGTAGSNGANGAALNVVLA